MYLDIPKRSETNLRLAGYLLPGAQLHMWRYTTKMSLGQKREEYVYCQIRVRTQLEAVLVCSLILWRSCLQQVSEAT